MITGEGLRGGEFFRFMALVLLLLFVAPGLLVAALVGNGLAASLRRRGRFFSRREYLGIGVLIMAMGVCVGLEPASKWHTAWFLAPLALVITLGAVIFFLAQRK